ncbi:MAG: hypothetical protein Q9181_000845, partial [Wetmoreana brouardii]
RMRSRESLISLGEGDNEKSSLSMAHYESDLACPVLRKGPPQQKVAEDLAGISSETYTRHAGGHLVYVVDPSYWRTMFIDLDRSSNLPISFTNDEPCAVLPSHEPYEMRLRRIHEVVLKVDLYDTAAGSERLETPKSTSCVSEEVPVRSIDRNHTTGILSDPEKQSYADQLRGEGERRTNHTGVHFLQVVCLLALLAALAWHFDVLRT